MQGGFRSSHILAWEDRVELQRDGTIKFVLLVHTDLSLAPGGGASAALREMTDELTEAISAGPYDSVEIRRKS